jgi:hypothetical protein
MVMADDIRIEHVALSEPQLRPGPFGDKKGQEWIEVAIKVKNHSASHTYFVMAGVRALKYEKETHTLVVSCSEPIRNLSTPHITIPDLLPVLPGETTTISVGVPVRIKALQLGKSLRDGGQLIDVSDVERVTCRVQYDDTPFHLTALSADRLTKELAEWGERTEKTFRARIGEEGREEANEPR